MTAVLTCNIGNIDEVVRPCEQSIPAQYYCYTENNLPYPLPNLGDRLKGKYLKINAHRFLGRNYENYIWVDGRVRIISNEFVKFMTEPLRKYDIVIPLHQYRKNVYEEIDFIKTHMNEGNDYLLKRYAHEPFDSELEFYRSEGLPEDFPLFACGVFARNNNEKLNRVFRDWWLRSIEFTSFDQAMFSYIVWEFGLKVYSFPYEEILKYVSISKHKTVK